MAKEFLAVGQDPQRLFSQIQDWAASTGVRLVGDASGGTFEGRPRGLAAIMYPVISVRMLSAGTGSPLERTRTFPRPK